MTAPASELTHSDTVKHMRRTEINRLRLIPLTMIGKE